MKRVEIAGGGIGGMVTALALARHGWQATVHERSDAIREAGAGIYIRNNSIEVLEEFGLFERLAPLVPSMLQARLGASGRSRRRASMSVRWIADMEART
jgi:2-polyprenyl-6-methoxyphenol hydroxylase-like FAD-dependent oxidoreductase